MKLVSIEGEGFRSLKEVEISFEPLTVLIGENDSGKSSVLDLLDIVLNNRIPEESDFHLIGQEKRIDKIQVILSFRLYDDDVEAKKYSIDDLVKLKKTFDFGGNQESWYLGEKPIDERLNVVFESLTAQQQREKIIDLDANVDNEDLRNAETRMEWFNSFKNNAPKKPDWVLTPTGLISLLPRFERYSAMDYNDPRNIISKTLIQVYEQTIFETEDIGDLPTKRLVEPLRDVEAQARANIQIKVRELKSHIQKYITDIHNIGYEPAFDFRSSLKPGEFLLDRGYGLHAFSRIGDGTKRRMFMAVTEWDRDVTLERTKTGSNLPSIIRGYDEPDTNLHYYAQRLMFYSISEIVNVENSYIQAILCTHSLTMIDRAPALNIRLFSLNDKGCTTIDQLITNDDPNIEYFLKELALELGITNSLMFYERCFVLIEGNTEESALPILYRKLNGRSLIEDCIRLINLKTNSAAREFLKLLGQNRREIIIIFVDKDSDNCKDANLSRASLNQLGFDDEFISEQVLFIGDQEFEDAFSDISISRTLQLHWPKSDGNEWSTDEISALRSQGKFSELLRKTVWGNTPQDGNPWSKPIFGRALAESCEIHEIPEAIIDLFTIARKITGIDIS